VFALGAPCSPTTPGAAADPVPVIDLCAAGGDDLLPPGENGNATLAEILGNVLFGTQPAHSSDQLARYDSLVAGQSTLTDDKLTTFFNDASFGVRPTRSSRSPPRAADVTITRDKQTGVPHIKGHHPLRHRVRRRLRRGSGPALDDGPLPAHRAGRADPFAGGALANQGLEQQFWPSAPYTEADLQAQVDRIRTTEGERGELAMADAQAYVDGINAYRQLSKDAATSPVSTSSPARSTRSPTSVRSSPSRSPT